MLIGRHISPDQFFNDFKDCFSTWKSFQGNKFKNIRESWVVATFLRTYNRFFNLNYALPTPVIRDTSHSIPDIRGCINDLNNKIINFEIGEILFDGESRAKKYENINKEPEFRNIISNPEAINIVKNNLLKLLEEKILADYGKNTFLLLYFNPSCDAGEELFFDHEKIIQGFLNEKEFKEVFAKNKIFEEIWLLTGRINNGYNQIISIFPNFNVVSIF